MPAADTWTVRSAVRLAHLAVLVALSAGCATVPMGGECSQSSECMDDGTCLKGVCSGYACDGPGDCTDGLECGEVGGASVCVQTCEGDDECLGSTTCVDVQSSPAAADTGGPASVCL